jgi:hypothetical protein
MPRSATKYECLRRCRATLDRGLGVILDPQTAVNNAFNPLWNREEGTNADDEIVYHTGLPAKSGVGGGLIARCHRASSESPSCLRRSMTRATASARVAGNRRHFKNALGGNPLAPTAR